MPDPWYPLRGEVREGPEHRGHGRRGSQELRSAGARRLIRVATHPVRLRSDARSDRSAHGHADPDGEESPAKGGTRADGKPGSRPARAAPASSVAAVSRVSMPAYPTERFRNRGRTGPSKALFVRKRSTAGRDPVGPLAIARASESQWGWSAHPRLRP